MDRTSLRNLLTSEGLLSKEARKSLELLDNLDNEHAVQDAWPDVTYKGKPLLPSGRMYPFYARAEGAITEKDFQEVFMGYDPVKDVFIVGFDVWPDDNWEDEYEEDHRYARVRQLRARGKTAMMSAEYVVVKFDGRVLAQHAAPGGFYPNGLKDAKRRFPRMISIRLD